MACIILHDESTIGRAIFFCTTSERPVNHEAFIGPDAYEQAEDFLAWNDFDPREYPLNDGTTLDLMLSVWRAEAFDARDNFVGTEAQRV